MGTPFECDHVFEHQGDSCVAPGDDYEVCVKCGLVRQTVALTDDSGDSNLQFYIVRETSDSGSG